MMKIILHQTKRDALLTSLENQRKPKAKANLTRRERGAELLDRAVKRSEKKLDEIGDHGQVSRQIHDKETLSYHHMFAHWPVEVWLELIPLLAVEFGIEVVQTVRVKERA
jgi:hypothetical protein